MSDAYYVEFSFDQITEALADVYREAFVRRESDVRMKRVEARAPESVDEYPYFYFVADTGVVEMMTFATDLERIPHRRRSPLTFGAELAGDVRRPKALVTHRFKGQLLVTPRRDMPKDEALARPFIEPVILVCAENVELGERVKYVRVTNYRYGILPFGKIEDRAIEFLGIEFDFEAQVIL